MASDPEEPANALGAYLRAQRRLANLSLRQLAELAQVSNPYLSQIERGLHEPSVHVLRSIARALNLSAETLLEQVGLLERDGPAPSPRTESAIRGDDRLTEAQKQALLTVYRTYLAGNGAEAGEPAPPSHGGDARGNKA